MIVIAKKFTDFLFFFIFECYEIDVEMGNKKFVKNRRALGLINQNLMGAQAQAYPCVVVNKRSHSAYVIFSVHIYFFNLFFSSPLCEIKYLIFVFFSKLEVCEKKQADPAHRPITRFEFEST